MEPANDQDSLNRNISTNQLLIVDADDTLWENNIFFERALDEFLAAIGEIFTREQVQRYLHEIQREHVKTIGYGTRGFIESLRQCARSLSLQENIPPPKWFDELCERLLERPKPLMPFVRETLAALQERHKLVLLTKGEVHEQKASIERSGLANYFVKCHIVKDKTRATYRRMAKQYTQHPEASWMIGNSPRADINPALMAGLNAVFIAHPNTWALENAELVKGPGRLIILERFADLVDYF